MNPRRGFVVHGMPTAGLSILPTITGKSHIFPKCFEFVGIDVCLDGNCPAMSKHQLLKHWPQPETVQDVAKFIRFAQFYSKFIPHFELQIASLCELTTTFEYTDIIAPHWTTAALDTQQCQESHSI